MILAEIIYNGRLDTQAWILLTVTMLIIIGGVWWCLYRAWRAPQTKPQEQFPDEI